jgi:hypothetical protein
LVLPVESDLQTLRKFCKNDSITKKYNLQFAIRFDLLFYRCRHSFLQELLNISAYLATLKDPSYQTKVLAESLCRAVVKLGTENIQELGHTIEMCEEKKLPCVEVELRLLQLSVHCLVKRARRMDCLRGKTVAENAKIVRVNGQESFNSPGKGLGRAEYTVHDAANTLLHKDALEKPNLSLDTESSLTRIFELGQRYPRSAGKYTKQAGGIKSSLNNGLRPGPIFTEEARVAERAWGDCKVVTQCGNGHPYPEVVFEECPECGYEKVPTKEPDYEAYLSEDKFLAWMRNN